MDEDNLDTGRLLSAIERRQKSVTGLIGRRSFGDAIKVAIESPPLGSKNDEVKLANHEVVMSALSSVKENEMAKCLEGLDEDELDILMKYIYRGLSDSKDCSLLLKWHATVVAKGGHGCIVRVMTDKKTA